MESHPFTVGDLLSALDEIAPFSLAESWDNVGLLAGDPGEPVGGILVALDPTEEVLVEAVAGDCNVVVTHHPPIFKAFKSIRTDLPEGRLLAGALAAKVALIACHTNLDRAGGGVNDVLARRLGLEDIRPLAGSGPEAPGFGRLGTLPAPVAGEEMLAQVARALAVETLSYAGPLPATVQRVAVCGGSGSELAEEAHRQGAQLFLTAEVKHSTARWA
ncbi:MAG: Nif3-like dinuclear metal center hexameric protein, partial [Desulfobulbaceae bacterium]|nr:Nif3-like dinuclear metal center hexameric protein [Desulfobulbaceae bacterium]